MRQNLFSLFYIHYPHAMSHIHIISYHLTSHIQCRSLITEQSHMKVKGKGEMMTYFVNLTDDLFLVEKSRHGEEEEDWREEHRFYA